MTKPKRVAVKVRWSLKKPVLHARGPRVKTTGVSDALPYLGPYASIPQRILTQALIRRGEKVSYEVPFAGGRSKAGGMVVDIWLPNRGRRGMVIRVQGEYWHRTGNATAKDDAQSLYLRARGIVVIDVWERDILTRLKWVLETQMGQVVG